MKRRSSILKDNRGSTLLMVIISIAFIGILCSLLLSLTVCNIQMKSMNYKAQANFYQAEEILEKIKMGIEEETAEAVKYAYEEVMKVYIVQNEAYKKEMFKREFLTKLELILSGSSPGTYKDEPVKRYASGPNVTISTDGPLEKTENAIILKDIKVTYEDAQKYKTTIRTDLVIEIPAVGFSIVPNFPPTFASYCLLADKQLKIPDTKKGVVIKGDVYAGNGGILLEGNSEMEMDLERTSNIVTRGNISVKNSGYIGNDVIGLTITGNPAIWAKNIETVQGINSGVAKIDIDGNCYIKDDLMLGAKNSNVILCGDYFGYSYGSDSSAESSSAVIINGSDSTLDMEKVEKLTIAGRAYINTNNPGDIQTGESLAIKNNQYAYLVPDEYIWCGTNPVSNTELINYQNEHPGMPEVVFDDNAVFKISNYTTSFERVYSNTFEDLVYYYLKFPSEEIANRYLQDYYQVTENKNNINNWVSKSSANIKINSPTNSIVSVGNLFSYSGGEAILTPNRVNPTEESDNDALKLLKNISANLEKRYVSMINTLSDISSNSTPETTVPSLFDSIVKRDEIAADLSLGSHRTVMVGEYVVCIINNAGEPTPFIIDANLYPTGSELKGIIIATGSVQVSKDFTGLILSGDTILMDNNVTVSASDVIVKSIISANNSEVNQYFRNYCNPLVTETGIIGTNGSFDVSKLITYENWTKNED